MSTQSKYRPGSSLQDAVGTSLSMSIVQRNGAWWVQVAGQWIGYFPDGLWRGRLTRGDTAFWYGQVFSAAGRLSPGTEMGSGSFGGTAGAESIDSMCVYSIAGGCTAITDGTTYETDPNLYTVSYSSGDNQSHGGPGTNPGLTYPFAQGEYYHDGVQKSLSPGDNEGVGGRLEISNPKLRVSADQVTNEMSVVSGDNQSLVEVGYRKYDSPEPTLMIGVWVNGAFQDTEGFVATQSVYTPGMSLGKYVGKSVQIYVQQRQGAWWIWFNDRWIGYVPDSVWNGSFTSGETDFWYGEVYSAAKMLPPGTEMGDGDLASNDHATSISGMCSFTSVGQCSPISGAETYVDDPYLYTLSYGGGSYERSGGPGTNQPSQIPWVAQGA